MPDLPAHMKAIAIVTPGPPDVLRLAERPVPVAGPGEVLIKVAAAGVNRPDIVQRQGNYAAPPGASDLPGLEVAGTVVALGADAGRWQVGDPVCALLAGGGYAEYATTPAVQCLPIPAGLSLAEAASLPETVFTVWANIFDRAHFKPGDTVLIHGGSSGIGVAAIQMVTAMGGRAIVTVGSAAKVTACVALGAHPAINYRDEDFVGVVKMATGGKGVDIVLDMIGGDYAMRNQRACATEGRIVSIAFLSGGKPQIDVGLMMAKRLTLTGSMLRSRPVADKAAIAAAVEANIWPLVAAGKVKPVVYATLPLAEAAEAHRLMESSAHIGKIVLTV